MLARDWPASSAKEGKARDQLAALHRGILDASFRWHDSHFSSASRALARE